jgi:hypothetical protein
MPDPVGSNRYQFLITNGAVADLRACKERDAYAAAQVSELLREILDGEVAAQALVDEHYYDEVIDSICPLWNLQDRRINAYRVRLVVIQGWRIITAVDHMKRRVGIFAVMPREADYERDRGLWGRIEREYDELDFARY